MQTKIFDSEYKLLELLWPREPVSAKTLSLVAAQEIGWNKNTTYTILKKLVEKGYVRRDEPGFLCTSLVSRDEVRRTEAKGLIDRLFSGSRKLLFSALLEDEALAPEEIDQLRQMIDGR